MIEKLIEFDHQLFLLLNGAHTAWLDAPMQLFSHRLAWLGLYAWLIYWLWKNALSKSVFAWQLAGIGLTLLLADRVSSGLLKPFFARLRPCHNPEFEGIIHLLEGCAGQFGFVSSHAANTFGAAMFFWLLWHKKWPSVRWLFAWAALVSYSRIYVGKHYPADVVAGACVGLACGWAAYWVYEQLKQRYAISV
ncbi:undecaprenyl-diphosphatase [Flexibacter flexilis DSM 6793]|uniref:Undecaprenyl-diphosphatase n=1 Tax=Flexibacter flexilis DSM 6793 TaxID=927664 RepID=A0A1I1DQ76_9BACT|nr:phosphatase PAP2 family protein [Flexibacter flexilis]SFB77149.1 undecaprenyl-diphosphatase [Flexibacter flexilis DSM 6793]